MGFGLSGDFVFLSFSAILIHRWLPGSRNFKKSVHLCLQGVALGSGVFGIWTKFHGEDGIVANFYSLHSWMGLICICLFGAQVLFFNPSCFLELILVFRKVPLTFLYSIIIVVVVVVSFTSKLMGNQVIITKVTCISLMKHPNQHQSSMSISIKWLSWHLDVSKVAGDSQHAVPSLSFHNKNWAWSSL